MRFPISPPTTEGEIRSSRVDGNGWAVLFSHRRISPPSVHGAGYLGEVDAEFDKRNTKVIGMRSDSVEDQRSLAAESQDAGARRMNTR